MQSTINSLDNSANPWDIITTYTVQWYICIGTEIQWQKSLPPCHFLCVVTSPCHYIASACCDEVVTLFNVIIVRYYFLFSISRKKNCLSM